MAVLHDLLARRRRACRSRRWRHDARLPKRPLRLPRRRGPPPRRRVRRRDRHRRRDRDGSSRSARPRASWRPRSSTRTCTCARPGREDEETIASGTAAAAAGGYCAIVAMPNTDPVVDSAPILRGLVEQARREAVVPVGFMAAITRSLEGEELTELGELADAGAVAFTDDGRPVGSAGLMRRALQYGAVTGRTLALHCEEPTLSGDGQMHEGAVSAELGLAGYPSVAESAMVERDLSLAAIRAAPDPPPAPVGARVGRGARGRAGARGGGERRGHAAPPRAHRRGGALARPEREDEPAAAGRARPARARRRPPERRHRRGRHRPRAARARGEGGAVRGGAVRRHRPRDRVRGAQHAPRRAGPAVARDAARAHVRRACARARPARAAARGRRAGEPRRCSTPTRSGR